MALTVDVRITGAPEGIEKSKMERVVAQYNERLLQENPEATPLPTSTNVELRNSTEIAYTKWIRAMDQEQNQQTLHDDSYGVTKLRDLRELFNGASEADRLAIMEFAQARVG